MPQTSAGGRSASVSSSAPARDWRRIGLWLVSATMAYNLAEGGIALWAGLRAASVALVGFGLDSFIECTAAAALFGRLGVEAAGRPLRLWKGTRHVSTASSAAPFWYWRSMCWCKPAGRSGARRGWRRALSP
jgi:hypothetical protein